jgi:WD40 repeat protein
MELESAISTQVLSRKDLDLFHRASPSMVLSSNENHELLNSDFLGSLYNLMHQFMLHEIDNPHSGMRYENVSWKTTLTSVEEHRSLERPIANFDSSIDIDVDGYEYDGIDGCITDIQGIKWDSTALRSRILMDRRLNHKSFSNVPGSKQYGRRCVNVNVDQGLEDWEFKQFFKLPNPKMSHFQLINQTLCINRRRDIFFTELAPYDNDKFPYNIVKRINALSGEISTVLELDEVPTDRISVLECHEDLLLVGTLNGFLYVHNLRTKTLNKKLISTSPNGIVNSIKVFDNAVLISTNDGCLATVDLQSFIKKSTVFLSWAVNSITISPFNNHLRMIVGDNVNSFIIDDRVHETSPVEILQGHGDFSFSCDWSGDGVQLVTSNQDSTVRLYDIRNLRKSQFCLGGECKNSAIRTVKFNQSGNYLTYNESIDNINIVNLKSLHRSQIGSKKVISVFGKLTNAVFIDYDLDGSELLSIGICDQSVGGILQYQLEKSENRCMDFDYL